VKIGVKVEKEVSAEVGIEVNTKVRMATVKEIGFKIGVGFSSKS
jgi:hypothetical protein